MEAITVEAGRNLTLHQGLGHWTGALRTGSSTHALVEQVCSRSNMLHHVGISEISLEPADYLLPCAGQVVLFCAAL